MAHHFKFEVNVTVERVEGKFASRDEIADAIYNELQYAEPSTLDGLGADGMSSYEVTDFEIEEVSS